MKLELPFGIRADKHRQKVVAQNATGKPPVRYKDEPGFVIQIPSPNIDVNDPDMTILGLGPLKGNLIISI